MIAAVESCLAARRAVGFMLSNTEYLLRSFASFATDRNQTHVRTATAGNHQARQIVAALGISDREPLQAQPSSKNACLTTN